MCYLNHDRNAHQRWQKRPSCPCALTEKALLLDTGFGFINFKPIIESITTLPLIVVNSHGDIDHCAGNHLFDEVHISAFDYKILPMCDAQWLKEANLNYRLKKNLALGREMDVDAYWKTSVFDARYKLIFGGELFDLGGGHLLEVLPLPGHTGGSICLLNYTNGRLFSEDSIMQHNVYYGMDYSEPMRVYHDSLLRFWQMRERISCIMPAHSSYPLPPDVILQLA